MCGLVGFIANNHYSRALYLDSITTMTKSLYHRGPDDNGTFIDYENKIAMGHTRLSILDLSKKGSQPMTSNDTRYTIIYNGEIYNHKELRNILNQNRKINRISWQGNSDTETLLTSISEWGVLKTLKKIDGMFALALWDKKEKKIILSRDRFGEKPLYYGWSKNFFLFGSELKALKLFPSFNNNISKKSLSYFMKYSYIPTPLTIYENIYKIEPGSLVVIDPNFVNFKSNEPLKENQNDGKTYVKYWWKLENSKKNISLDKINNTNKITQKLDNLLSNAVKKQLISDVPIGCFLSGGIDSSTIATLMQKQSNSKIETFTIGFEDKNYDESIYAKKIAKHLGTNHNELILNNRSITDIIYNLSNIYDEPFADSSQIPTCLISKYAAQKIKVALTGDGADEMFGGYNRYVWINRMWKFINKVPQPLLPYLSRLLLTVPISSWNKLLVVFNALFSNKNKITMLGDKIHKVANALKNVHNIDDYYFNILKTWEDDSHVVKGLFEEYSFENNLDFGNNYEILDKMMLYDSKTYLTDDILCKVDRASMAYSLETRAPMLDPEVVLYALSIPNKFKIKDNTGKWILRKVLNKYVPEKMFNRPKMGFAIPIGELMRNSLRDWVEYNLDSIKKHDYFDYKLIINCWNDHLSGKRNWQNKLWTVIMFQAWFNNK